MKNSKFLLLFPGLFLFLSCSDLQPIVNSTRFYECDSFVFGYWSPAEGTMEASAREHGLISVGCGERVPKYHFGAYSNDDEKHDAEGYRRYLDKCGRYSDIKCDTVYYVWGSGGPSYGYHYFAEEIRSVGISYSLDWSEGYPAGSELGGLFTLYAVSPLEYIRRGYTGRSSYKGHPDEETFAVIQELNLCDLHVGTRDTEGNINMRTGSKAVFDNFYGEPVVRKVSELTDEDLRLVGGGEWYTGECILFMLKPDFLPDDLSGVLTITVTTDSRTYTVPFNGLRELESDPERH